MNRVLSPVSCKVNNVFIHVTDLKKSRRMVQQTAWAPNAGARRISGIQSPGYGRNRLNPG